ncbi:hypothetical protein WM28_25025 [Burkholderia ubonensis]|uniref:hypothetical protein n=1 Tax=Burkholderia ubonensis TaxID=101571 RepID=UPI00075FB503|nr:hypothetical protein [Burkholderia ubonensis]KWO61995.1 hypothetical protein WM28_25025 [Burkholderia ubonensis]
MTNFTKERIAHFAKAQSPFYAELYREADADLVFEALPVATQDRVAFVAQGDHRKFQCLPQASGIIYSSSGTTGIAKLTKFDRNEWNVSTNLIANTHWKYGFLADGDIVANLATPGHASFMLVHDVLQRFPAPITEIAVGADQDWPFIHTLVTGTGVNVLTGVYSTFIALADYLVSIGETLPDIRQLLGGGEMLYGAQRDYLRKAFPNASLCAFLYGSTDAGNIGHNVANEEENVYQVFSSMSHAEIVNPHDHRIISEPGVPGLLTVTNLIRTNAPVVRYSNGDMAEWVSPPTASGQTFRLHGRRYPNIHFGNAILSGNTIAELIREVGPEVPLLRLEAVLDESAGHPRMTVTYTAIEPFVSEYDRIVMRGLLALVPALEGTDIAIVHRKLSDFPSNSRLRSKLLVDVRNGSHRTFG